MQTRIILDGIRVSQLGLSDRDARWRSINVLLYWLAFSLLLIVTVSGICVYYLPGVTPYESTLLIYRSTAWLLVVYIVLHVLAQFSLGGLHQLLKILSPKMAYTGAGITALVIAGAVGATIVALDSTTVRTLDISKTITPPLIDGDLSDSAWCYARTYQS